ncbi:MAG: ABC transporter permease [Bacteroidota bacterium]
MQKLTYNIRMALDSLLQRPARSVLTSLGIIFGVAAVIAMMAIGKGAEAEIVEQMRILGANNIIIEPIVEQSEQEVTDDQEEEGEGNRFSPGLTVFDAGSIQEIIPGVVSVSPEIVLESTFLRSGKKRSGKLIGVTRDFFRSTKLELERGKLFDGLHERNAERVCIIGYDVRSKFFTQESPIGKRIKVGKVWLTVIGVAAERKFSKASIRELGIRDYDQDIYVPLNTVLLRYKNRARVSPSDLRTAAMNRDDDEDGGPPRLRPNYHQIDRLVVAVEDGMDMFKVAEIVRRMLERRHNGVVDTEVVIPEELLAQKQRTTEIFNNVLISIAAISLLIGGIGIMNIMLASVMERIKEIGIRLSLGATKRDIVIQFLGEAVALSVAGGILGILVGVGLSLGIEYWSEVQTIISGLSIGISFFVAASIGVFFGFFPARKAARQDPVVSLRHE